MKTLNLIICLLAVTLFVACSKKKDGNSNPYNAGYNYGYTPNDPRYNNMYPNNNGIMPGYQLPQGACNGPTNMNGDLFQYCTWLATGAEQMCNPVMVRQEFMQKCQSFAYQLNYCVPMVRSGCFYSKSGCSYEGKSYKSTYVSARDFDDSRDSYRGSLSTRKQLPQVDLSASKPKENVLPPVQVIGQKPSPVTPAPQQQVQCDANPSKDCYEEKPGKPETRKCRHPKEKSNDKRKWNLTYETYLAKVQESCEQTVVAQPAPVQESPVQQLPEQVIGGGQDSSQTVVQEQQQCTTAEVKPWIDCRLKRGERASAVRGTDKKALKDFDFKKGSDGKSFFEKENARGNIQCKNPGDKKSSRNYVYNSYEAYAASLTRCESSSNVVTQPVSQSQSSGNVIAQAPQVSVQEQPVAVEQKAQQQASSSQCLNLETINNYLSSQESNLSSHSVYYSAQLLGSGQSKELVAAWKKAMQPIINKYSTKVYSSASQMSAIGSNVRQSSSSLRLGGKEAKIHSCDAKILVVSYMNEAGQQNVTYSSNGFEMNDDNYEVTETTVGTFKHGNETSQYILGRYIGVGTKLNESQIKSKVLKDMKTKNYIENDPLGLINLK